MFGFSWWGCHGGGYLYGGFRYPFRGGIWVVMFWVFMFMMLRYGDGLPIAIISDVPPSLGYIPFFSYLGAYRGYLYCDNFGCTLLRWGIFRFFRIWGVHGGYSIWVTCCCSGVLWMWVFRGVFTFTTIVCIDMMGERRSSNWFTRAFLEFCNFLL